MGSGLLLSELLGKEDTDALGPDVKERHSKAYADLAHLQRPFEGARDLVRAVKERGARTVLATSASPEELKRLLDVLDLDDAVDGITSAQDVDDAKPAPDLIHAALAIADASPDDAVMVGDSVWDIQAAQRAGVRCVAVLTGGASEHDLREAGAVAVYRDPAALLDDLDDSPLASTWSPQPTEGRMP
jgi:HAD superfamily hydrolase (TIGR01509 family)